MEKNFFFALHVKWYESVMQEIAQIIKESGKPILFFDDLDVKVSRNIKDGTCEYEEIDAVQAFNDPENYELCIAFYLKSKHTITISPVSASIIPIFDLIYVYEQMFNAYRKSKMNNEEVA